MIEQIKAYIVEDDQENIDFFKILINGYIPPIKIIGEATNQDEFADLLLKDEADVIFLDIELDEQKTSLEILDDFGGVSAEIVVISGSKEYALKALNEHNIAAYLLKPLSMLSLNKALIKVHKNIEAKKEIQKLTAVKTDVIAIPDLTSIEIIKTAQLSYLEAAGKYTVVHLLNGSSRTVSKNLGTYIETLPKHKFFRIHHKYLININETQKIYKTDGYYCMLKSGRNLPIAKRRVEELRKFLHLK